MAPNNMSKTQASKEERGCGISKKTRRSSKKGSFRNKSEELRGSLPVLREDDQSLQGPSNPLNVDPAQNDFEENEINRAEGDELSSPRNSKREISRNQSERRKHLESNCSIPVLDGGMKQYLKGFFDEIMKEFDQRITPIQHALTEMKTENSSIKDSIRSMEVVLEGAIPRKFGNFGKVEEETRADDRLTKFAACFNNDIIKRVMKGVIINFLMKRPNERNHVQFDVTNQYSDGRRNISDHFSFVICVLMFSRSPSDPKTVWNHEIGQEASNLRKKIVYSTIVNVQRNRFDQFIFKCSMDAVEEGSIGSESSMKIQTDETLSNSCGNMPGNESSKKKIEQPKWLSQLSDTHVETVRRLKEHRQNGKRKTETEKSNSQSNSGFSTVHIRATKKLFSMVVTELSDLRTRGRSIFLTN